MCSRKGQNYDLPPYLFVGDLDSGRLSDGGQDV